jgi:hypothetical protein
VIRPSAIGPGGGLPCRGPVRTLWHRRETGETTQSRPDGPAAAARAHERATPPQEQTSPGRTAEADIMLLIAEEALQVGTRGVQGGAYASTRL